MDGNERLPLLPTWYKELRGGNSDPHSCIWPSSHADSDSDRAGAHAKSSTVPPNEAQVDDILSG